MSGHPGARPPTAAPAAVGLLAVMDVLAPLAQRFVEGGHELSLVGGPVRDLMRGQGPAQDLDLTTSARPEVIVALLDGWADAVWDVGMRFGTVGARKGDHRLEITTYRTETYDDASRKPEVAFGDSLAGDLVRRDFTINAMAVRLPSLEFVDLHGGMTDLREGILRTPGTPEESFGDDPLRMMRAARFVSQLGFAIDPGVRDAMQRMASRIDIVSAERIRDELVKLLLGTYPREGLEVLVSTGLAEHVMPELPALQLELDEHHRHKDVYQHSLTVMEQAIDLETGHEPAMPADVVLRLAALLHDIGKPRTRKFDDGGGVSFHHHEVVGARMVRKRLTALRFPQEVVEDVSRLTELHLRFHGYGTGEWTDSAVRRYVRDAGDLLPRLHKLTRADCTTRNRRRAQALQEAYDGLEARIAELSEQEELASLRPDLDGNQIMAILGIAAGPEVGQAYRYLLEVRLDQGPLGPEAAEELLRAWWEARDARNGGSGPSGSVPD